MSQTINAHFARLKAALAERPPPSEIARLFGLWNVLLTSCRLHPTQAMMGEKVDWSELIESDFIPGILDLIPDSIQMDPSVSIPWAFRFATDRLVLKGSLGPMAFEALSTCILSGSQTLRAHPSGVQATIISFMKAAGESSVSNAEIWWKLHRHHSVFWLKQGLFTKGCYHVVSVIKTFGDGVRHTDER